ncbi:hypothetical protein NW756_014037 [Fusarium oxysporum]|nr:hypothetical protein NW763_014478 [Fusarium oxysporum]KAJ4050843.1 hypothetical protein NW753_007449 [Fusarium oxysporum]KAJ4073710.1 hypothetical protein NW756_014037 [Fusarium oxysporum]KAJ4080607.1 hypothetical protein NW769_014977 [Fusarium oxysporum]KAJ4214893.1 hypothetical protein NW760_014568 [Fusarium oxysporum]
MVTNPNLPTQAQSSGPSWPPSQSNGPAPSASAGRQDISSPSGSDDLPSISVPKAGGAIRSMGESFSVNMLSGTAGLNVPIRVSPGRSGFGPELSVAYSSNSPNGPFGMGWTLGLPTISRKTDKAIPQYNDREESDVFILSGHDDLIPLQEYKNGRWNAQAPSIRTVDGIMYEILGYRPRTEGLFSRIEKWIVKDTGETHWRTISRENVAMFFGTDDDSRITDPSGPRTFSWLLSTSYDDRGNAAVYEYKREDSTAVDLRQANEQNRSVDTRKVNRYIKRIKYGNIASRLVEPDLAKASWMFEVVFDYGEHDATNPTPDDKGATWLCRNDPFSTCRPGFEVRTYRLCQRILMFHHFKDEPQMGSDYLVSSTDFSYKEDDKRGGITATFLASVTYRGYERRGGAYLTQSMPPLELQYSPATLHDKIQAIDLGSLENLPIGIDQSAYKFIDLDGEGIASIIFSGPDAWYRKANLGQAKFASGRMLSEKPTPSFKRFMDLNGDGHQDLVNLGGAMSGFFRRNSDKGWDAYAPFESLPNLDWDHPNLRLVDLTGDGRADVLITEEDVISWYPFQGDQGFGENQRWSTPPNEDRGPRVIFADSKEEIRFADMSGDGLQDLVRLRNGDIVYWPNLGYGRFGPKVTMDKAPRMDAEDCFDARKVRMADIDGSGTADLFYLGGEGVQVYFNRAGNSFGDGTVLQTFPPINGSIMVDVLDLLGNGTSCLVWSSPLPGDAGRHMQFIDLMGGQKPHLLMAHANNMGSETRLEYTTSTKFYLEDKAAGIPWITRFHFPMHLVSRVQTIDRVSRNVFTSEYRYRHGYFDGIEREFGGFGYVEQVDTENLTALSSDSGTNLDIASHVPPVLTKTWYHTGIYYSGDRVSRYFEGEYYKEPSATGDGYLSDQQLNAMLLPDTVLPNSFRLPNGTDIPISLTSNETYDACRSLKGSILRQEVYALDGSDLEKQPYAVSETNYSISVVQPQVAAKHGVFVCQQREALEFHYERNLYTVDDRRLPDPRVSHTATLDVDEIGNVLLSVSISYPRRHRDQRPFFTRDDHAKQSHILATYSTSTFTNDVLADDAYRLRHLCESKSYDLINCKPQSALPAVTNLFRFDELKSIIGTVDDGAHEIPYEDTEASSVNNSDPHRRIIEHTQSVFRSDDLSAALSFGKIESLALPFETYTKAFTTGLAHEVYVDSGKATGSDMQTFFHELRYTRRDGDEGWWLPSGRLYYSPGGVDMATDELAFARAHFYHPHRFRDPFHKDSAGTEKVVYYDRYCLLPVELRDALLNRITVGSRGPGPSAPVEPAGNDYRVLKPVLVADFNRNQTAIRYDALGLLAGTALMGKPEESLGDNLDTFTATLSEDAVRSFVRSPGASASTLLGGATNRVVYDLFAYFRTRDSDSPQPSLAATIAREVHASDAATGPLQLGFSYSDGFGRVIQQKTQADPGPGPQRDPKTGEMMVVDGVPQMTSTPIDPRWIGSGWAIFNNKGSPVRQYEPFFTDTFYFEYSVVIGVGSITFYDPLNREIGQLNPDHTWTKTVFDSWSQEVWDVNDTAQIEPTTDPSLGSYFRRLPTREYLPTWSKQREGGQLGAEEKTAAAKCLVHRDTPSITIFDPLARAFATVSHNRQRYSIPLSSPAQPDEEFHITRIKLDIEGNQRQVVDAKGRVCQQSNFTMLGKAIREVVLDAGERTMLHDVSGKLHYSWDSMRRRFRTGYDVLQRPILAYVLEGGGPEKLVTKTLYGEFTASREQSNLLGRVAQVFDQAGIVTRVYDFKGNQTQSKRQLAADYKNTLDWTFDVPLDATPALASATTFDAMNRAVTLRTLDENVTSFTYNRTGLVKSVRAVVKGDENRTASVDGVEYNAKGQRTLVFYGNGTQTTWEYDHTTFRLRRMRTTRSKAAFPDDCPNPAISGWPGCQLQDLAYTYDPAGNVTFVKDSAQQRIFFRNQRVEPSNEYTYSAEYRLIEAVGREQLGQAGKPPIPGASPLPTVDHPNQDKAMGTYLEQSVWDSVGNIISMKHNRGDVKTPGWTRNNTYGDGNRLHATEVSGATESYTYDAHGNITSMPSLPVMQWDYQSQLRATARRAPSNGRTPETTYYTYDSSGSRVRKVTERQADDANPEPRISKERIYVGGREIYRTYSGDGQTKTLERETLHVAMGADTVALVETRTVGDESGNPGQLTRYQLANYLSSVLVELDDKAQIITYEEYAPFGTPTYRAARNRTETPKRYGYTNKERDEESGLTYHGVRYYMTWVARWTSCDPVKANAPRSLYAYGRGNPISYTDPTGTEDSHTHSKKHKGHKSSQPSPKPNHGGKKHPAKTHTPPAAAAPTSSPAATPPPPPSPPKPLTLPTNPADGAAFVAEVKTRLTPGKAVEFEDRGVHVVIMPLPTPSIVHSNGLGTFTGAATSGDNPAKSDYVINGLLYERSGFSYRGQGLTIEGGAVTSGRPSPDTYYFAWNKPVAWNPSQAGPATPPLIAQHLQWQFGAGNPPAGSDVAMGGGKPLIIGGLPYGNTNIYKPGAPAGLPTTGSPGQGNEQYLAQRSSAGFTALNNKGALEGNTVMGVVPGDYNKAGDQNLLVLMVHEDSIAPGITLAGMRDSFIAMGASDALAYDGSTSSTLVRDSTIVVAPSVPKNSTIPVGLRFQF